MGRGGLPITEGGPCGFASLLSSPPKNLQECPKLEVATPLEPPRRLLALRFPGFSSRGFHAAPAGLPLLLLAKMAPGRPSRPPSPLVFPPGGGRRPRPLDPLERPFASPGPQPRRPLGPLTMMAAAATSGGAPHAAFSLRFGPAGKGRTRRRRRPFPRRLPPTESSASSAGPRESLPSPALRRSTSPPLALLREIPSRFPPIAPGRFDKSRDYFLIARGEGGLLTLADGFSTGNKEVLARLSVVAGEGSSTAHA